MNAGEKVSNLGGRDDVATSELGKKPGAEPDILSEEQDEVWCFSQPRARLHGGTQPGGCPGACLGCPAQLFGSLHSHRAFFWS